MEVSESKNFSEVLLIQHFSKNNKNVKVMSVSYHNSFLQPDLSYIKIFEMKLIHRKYIMTFILYILLKRDQHNGRELVNPKEEIEDAQFS